MSSSRRSSRSATRFRVGTDSRRSRTGSRCTSGRGARSRSTSTTRRRSVAFPYVAAGPTAANSQNDFDNSQVSRLDLNRRPAGIWHGEMAITSGSNYQRFCSNYLATADRGLQPADALHERGGAGLGLPLGDGVDLAHRSRHGRRRANRRRRRTRRQDRRSPRRSTAWGGSTTRTTSPFRASTAWPCSPETTRSRRALRRRSSTCTSRADRDALWNDKGTLYAFVADDPTKNDYFDVQAGDAPISGQFLPVPKMIATGKKAGRDRAPVDRLPRDGSATVHDPERPAVGARPVGQRGEQRVRRRTSSTSSASRTPPTTSGRGCRTSSTSPTPAAEPLERRTR